MGEEGYGGEVEGPVEVPEDEGLGREEEAINGGLKGRA